MEVTRNGKFLFSFKDLQKGLRKTKETEVNTNAFINCTGAVVKDNVLQTINALTTIDTSILGGSFPYPQLFIFTNLIIACNETEIYEYVNNVWTLMFTGSAGSTWDAVAFHDFVYLSNGRNKVTRDPITKLYTESTTLPTYMAICNFNGQVIIGSPNAGYI